MTRAAGNLRRIVRLLVAGVATAALAAASVGAAAPTARPAHHPGQDETATPIKHLVVIFDENISFDHYFGTYPDATNTDGHPFHAKRGTPAVNGLTSTLLQHNPNAYPPKRLGPAQAYTCDQNHNYDNEQKAFNGGLMNKFVEHTGRSTCTGAKHYSAPGLVMDYYDGNTITALWNYAQRFAMSDNSYGSNFGPSTPGAINLVSGNTHGAVATDQDGNRVNDLNDVASPDENHVGTLVKDPDPQPTYDDCSSNGLSAYFARFQGRNIGDLLNAKHVTWGWFQGGFTPTSRTDGKAVCGLSHANIAGDVEQDYSAHHDPFQYYKQTANPHHLPPTSIRAIGHGDQANHQYDLSDFYQSLDHHNLPAVSFLKAAQYQDGHAGYSDPIDEQHFLVTAMNRLQASSAWKSTAVVIAYDDSDGWYDHAMGPIVNSSSDPQQDWLNGQGRCGDGPPLLGYQDRCGYGPRLPLLVLSPYAKTNYVSSALTDQTSVIKFVEDNWRLGRIGDGSYDALAGSLSDTFTWRHPTRRPLFLDPNSGKPTRGHHH